MDGPGRCCSYGDLTEIEGGRRLDQVGNLDAAGAIEREAPCGLSHERKGQGRLFLQGLPRYDDTRGAQTCSKAYTTGTGSGRTDARARRCVDRPVPKTFIVLRLRHFFWILFSKSTIRSRPVLLDDTEPIPIYVILMTLKEDTKTYCDVVSRYR